MSTQPLALVLADLLNSRNGTATGFGLGPLCDQSAAELRRLHALNAQMLEALLSISKRCPADHAVYNVASVGDMARNAIAAAKGQA